MKLGFFDIFSKNAQILNLMKISPVEVEFRADGQIDSQTDMTKLIVAFRNVTNAPKSCTFCLYCNLMFF